jgi:hypothetical protein
MKASRVSLATVGIALLLSACASPPVQRAESNPMAFHSLSAAEKNLVLRGEVARGMNKKAVLLAWGEPDRKTTRHVSGLPYEKWTYNGYRPTFGSHTTYDLGDGYRCHGFTGPVVDDQSPESAGNYLLSAVRNGYFVDDRLTAWDTLW